MFCFVFKLSSECITVAVKCCLVFVNFCCYVLDILYVPIENISHGKFGSFPCGKPARKGAGPTAGGMGTQADCIH